MGFGFNIFGFPILIITSAILLIYFFTSKSKTPQIILAVIWGLVTLLFIHAAWQNNAQRPMQMSRADAYGDYRIDTTFYPGRNARWQYAHYRFSITRTDSIAFMVMTDTGTEARVYKHKIKYSSREACRWSIDDTDTTFHVIKHPPTLYRKRYHFYYVFHSDRYGEMCFSKQR